MKIALSKDVSVRKIEDEIFVFNRKDSRIHSFNATGAFLWERLNNDPDSELLVSSLLSEYETTIEVANADVASFLKSLNDAGLITFV
jgi:hypothetical protein